MTKLLLIFCVVIQIAGCALQNIGVEKTETVMITESFDEKWIIDGKPRSSEVFMAMLNEQDFPWKKVVFISKNKRTSPAYEALINYTKKKGIKFFLDKQVTGKSVGSPAQERSD